MSKRKPDSLALSALIPAPYNPRRISEAQMRDLASSMDADGDLGVIVYNARSGRIVSGHQRLRRIRDANPDAQAVIVRRFDPNAQGTVAEGYVVHEGERWAFRIVDWDDEREMRANVKANRLGGEWDDEALVQLLDHLASTDAGLAGTGYDDDALDDLLATAQPQALGAGGKLPEDMIGGFLSANVKQIVLAIPAEDYEPTLNRLAAVMEAEGLDSNTAAVLHCLACYEAENAHAHA